MLFFAGFSHAVTLEGTIIDAIKDDKKSIREVKVVLDNANPANSTDSSLKGFKLKNFNPTITQTITFTKDGYDEQTGEISIKAGKLVYNGGDYTDSDLGEAYLPVWGELEGKPIITGYENIDGSDTITLPAIKLIPTAKEIISGTIYYEDDEGDALPLDFDADNVSVELSGGGIFAEFTELELLNNGNFRVMGYFDETAEKGTDYEITINYPEYKEKIAKITVEKTKVENHEIIIDEPTATSSREKNLEAITGFDCSDLMPKYLVGANCVENKTLDGDATDLAVWIQKFGGKITSMISMIAVVLIVWNAFNIVTAAGEEEKISKGKKGIMWTILGLALTMFAYVIVKTVIMFTYT